MKIYLNLDIAVELDDRQLAEWWEEAGVERDEAQMADAMLCASDTVRERLETAAAYDTAVRIGEITIRPQPSPIPGGEE